MSRKSYEGEGATLVIPIATAGFKSSSTSSTIYIEPEWPLDDSYFYVFRQPVKFYCLPSQVSS
ncbi:hypothetical protein B0J17DRAFT_403152 [Rhizoctonia solani]|nr:hypothetical protein B0J17DRAFT_403152 [Rhizoctonia solani]